MQFKLQEANKTSNDKERQLSEQKLDNEELKLKIEELEENLSSGGAN